VGDTRRNKLVQARQSSQEFARALRSECAYSSSESSGKSARLSDNPPSATQCKVALRHSVKCMGFRRRSLVDSANELKKGDLNFAFKFLLVAVQR